MKRTALVMLDLIGERQRSAASDALLRALRVAKWPATALVLGLSSTSNAQVIPSTSDLITPPWNAQQVFEPSLPSLSDLNSRESIQPEDMPVKQRQQPGYEPVGIPRRFVDVQSDYDYGRFLRQQRFLIQQQSTIGFCRCLRAFVACAYAVGTARYRPQAGCTVHRI